MDVKKGIINRTIIISLVWHQLTKLSNMTVVLVEQIMFPLKQQSNNYLSRKYSVMVKYINRSSVKVNKITCPRNKEASGRNHLPLYR